MQPTAIIGDIHGEAGRLRAALQALWGRRLVCVGDYINRGPDSREVLDLLADVRQESPGAVVLLEGNHEVALLRWLRGGDQRSFLLHGGLRTIGAYLGADAAGPALQRFRDSFPKRHLDLLESLRTHLEEDGLFVSHAGYDAARPHARDRSTMTLGGGPAMFERPDLRPRELTVFGHYVQNQGRPYDSDGLVCLDTGCGTIATGPLTALLLPEREFLQF